jgi:hypothetical protein
MTQVLEHLPNKCSNSVLLPLHKSKLLSVKKRVIYSHLDYSASCLQDRDEDLHIKVI